MQTGDGRRERAYFNPRQKGVKPKVANSGTISSCNRNWHYLITYACMNNNDNKKPNIGKSPNMHLLLLTSAASGDSDSGSAQDS